MGARAVIIGINAYPQSQGVLKPLHGAVADAADFADWALDPAGGKVEDADLYFWTFPTPAAPSPRLATYLNAPTPWPRGRPDFTRPPSATEIKHLVTEAAKRAGLDGAGRLYIFLAGHGVRTKNLNFNEDDQNCFIAGDYNPGFITDSLVPCDDLRRVIQRIGPREAVLFFDCCRTDLPPYQSRPSFGGALTDATGAHEVCGVGHAAQPGATAYETPRHAPSRGAFSRLLIYGLRQLRHAGRLTVSQLEQYILAGIDGLTAPQSQMPSLDVIPKHLPLVLVEGPPLGSDPRIVFNGGVAGQSWVLVRPDRTRTVIDPVTIAPMLAPIGVYGLESPAGDTLQTVQHLGPEDTHVALA